MPAKEFDEKLGEAKSELERFYVDLWSPHESETPEHLYHYTSIEGVVGILQKRCFFATDVLASPDRSEIRHGFQLAAEVLGSLPSHLLYTELLKSFEKSHGMLGLGTDSFLHAVCFCHRKDSLTQWRGYSSSGGFAIEISCPELLRESESGTKFAIGRILYPHDRQRKILEETFSYAASVFDRLVPYFESVPRSELQSKLSAFLLEVGISLIKSTFHFKSEAFESEDEWRVFTLETRESLSGRLKFRSRPNAIMPYVELPFEAPLVSRLVCSPGPWSSAIEYSIRRLADSLGNHLTVEESKLPI